MDQKRWDDWLDVFVDDVRIDAPIDTPGQEPVVGRENFVAFLAPILDGVITCHHGHTSEITITGPDTAEGVWAMEDRLDWPPEKGGARTSWAPVGTKRSTAAAPTAAGASPTSCCCASASTRRRAVRPPAADGDDAGVGGAMTGGSASTPLDVRPFGAALGAEVRGIDVRQAASPELRDAIRRALLTHHVLAFPHSTSTTPSTSRSPPPSASSTCTPWTASWAWTRW